MCQTTPNVKLITASADKRLRWGPPSVRRLIKTGGVWREVDPPSYRTYRSKRQPGAMCLLRQLRNVTRGDNFKDISKW